MGVTKYQVAYRVELKWKKQRKKNKQTKIDSYNSRTVTKKQFPFFEEQRAKGTG